MSNLQYLQRAGVQFEIDFFGFSVPFDKQKVDQMCAGKKKSFHYRVGQVINCQANMGWDPKLPSKGISQDLFLRVRDRIGSALGNDLRMCCALGTYLDYFYGIDGFWFLANNPPWIVSFDLNLTGSIRKMAKKKSTFLITKKMLDSSLLRRDLVARISDKLMIGRAKCLGLLYTHAEDDRQFFNHLL